MKSSDNSDRKASWSDVALQTAREAFEIGAFILKALVTVNAGALIALLALYPKVGEAPIIRATIPDASCWFVFGLVAALVSAMVTFCYQTLGTVALKFEASSRPVLSILLGLFVLVLCLALFSLVSFVVGLRIMVAAF